MIVVLKGADFSANNLGQINISGDARTQTMTMLGYFHKTFTKEQRIAIDEFVAKLQDLGIWDKITNLYLPIIATDRTDAMFNLKQTYGSTGKTVDTALNTIYGISDGKGLTVLNSGSVTNTGIPMAAISNMNCHMMMLLTDVDNNTGYGDKLFYSTNATVNANRASSTDKMIFNGLVVGTFAQNDAAFYGKGMKGISSGQNASITILGTNYILSASPFYSSETIYNNQVLDLLCYGSTSSKAVRTGITKIGLISIGYYLSIAEVTAYNSACVTLMNVFGVEI